jgi:signal transduction histidine kinase
MLNFSRLTYTNEHFEDMDLNEHVQKVISDFDLLIQEKSASVKVGKLPVIKAIPVQINQLFANLLSNALKFSNKKPRITINSTTIQSPDVFDIPGLKPEIIYHQFSIKDNGIGFEQKYAEKIFTIFQRLNDNQVYNGTGIGLALCKKIVENHEGIINARSVPGHGSVFNFFLPAIE